MIIIGAGIAGLSAGIYAQASGYSTRIFEMHDKPGGMCTSWKRQGYVFDYSIHNLAGTGASSGLRRMWDELGAFDGLEMIDLPEFVRIENYDGRSFTMHSSIDSTVAELRRLSPPDEGVIRDYERTAHRVAKIDFFGTSMGGTSKMLVMLPKLPMISRLSKVTLEDYGARFSDPFLKRAFPLLQYGLHGIPLLIHFVFLGGLDRGDLGAVKGGSLAFARGLEAKYKAHGGSIEYGRKVEKVIVKGDKAVGVRLADGSEHFADIIVSAADGRSTILGMLDGRYKTALIEDYYTKGWWPQSQGMGLSVYLGVKRDIEDEPHAISLLFKEPLLIGGQELDHLDLELYSAAAGMAPPGKGVIKVNLSCDYEQWKQFKDLGSYHREKEKLASEVITSLERRFPGIGEQVEAKDVVTLLTCERYTGNFRGLEPWPSKRDQRKVMRKGLSRELPGLGNFHMIGQWAEGDIGIPTAALSARRMVKEQCKRDGL